jgi:hypothetical protein
MGLRTVLATERHARQPEARLQALASSFLTIEATGQGISDSHETQTRLVEFVGDAKRVLGAQLGPPPFRYRLCERDSQNSACTWPAKTTVSGRVA